MKIYDVEIPADLEIPELDAKSRAEADAVHEAFERDREKMKRTLAAFPYKEWAGKILTEEDAWRLRYPGATGPLPKPTISVEGLRKLPPHLRAIFVYLHRAEVTY